MNQYKEWSEDTQKIITGWVIVDEQGKLFGNGRVFLVFRDEEDAKRLRRGAEQAIPVVIAQPIIRENK